MSRLLLLAWRYLAYHKLRSLILIICVTITLTMPVGVHVLVREYSNQLVRRAEATPFVVGTVGHRFDLVMSSLYFRLVDLPTISMAEAKHITESNRGLVIPMHVCYSARDYTIVGTTVEYFDFRGLHPADGDLPTTLGEAVIGSKVAEELGLKPGDSLLSDQKNLYDLSATYPLKMHVVGVLAESHSADDYAVLIDLKTAWIIDGIGHGHQKAETDPAAEMTSDTEVMASAGIVQYQEVTPENLGSFHFHGEPETFPISAIIVVPKDAKSGTLLKASINHQYDNIQVIVPIMVVEELIGIVLKIETFMNANYALVGVTTLLFLILVFWLSLRIRRREMETMFKIGCSRWTVFGLQASELALIFIISAICSTGLCLLMVRFAPQVASL